MDLEAQAPETRKQKHEVESAVEAVRRSTGEVSTHSTLVRVASSTSNERAAAAAEAADADDRDEAAPCPVRLFAACLLSPSPVFSPALRSSSADGASPAVAATETPSTTSPCSSASPAVGVSWTTAAEEVDAGKRGFVAVTSAERGFPLHFETVSQRINFIAVRSLLSFGSGYRQSLRLLADRGAYTTICYGLTAMHLTHGDLTAEVMQRMQVGEVATLFHFPVMRMCEVMPGLERSQPNQLRPLADRLSAALLSAASTLRSLSFPDFASFIRHQLQRIHSSTTSTNSPSSSSSSSSSRTSTCLDPAAQLVSAIVTHFPSFADHALYNDEIQVAFHHKAQLLVADLYRELRTEDEIFNFADIDRLTVCADNVVPAILRELGILQVSEELGKRIDSGEELESGSQEELELRSCAVQACERIVEQATLLQQQQQQQAARVEDALAAADQEPDAQAQEDKDAQEQVGDAQADTDTDAQADADSTQEPETPLPRVSAYTLTQYLWQMSRWPEYQHCQRHYTRDTSFY